MSFVEFYMDVGSGSNLNAGSTAGAAVYTSTAGNWDGTSVFTPTDGQTTSSLVAAGDWCSIYATGSTITPYVAKVVTVAAGVDGAITLSTTLKFGTAPTSGTGTRVAKTGGAWASLALVASGGCLNTGIVTQSTRINVKAGTYANTTTVRSLALAGTATIPLWWRGYKTTIGDQDTNNIAISGTDIPNWTWTTSAYCDVTGVGQIFSNIDFSGTSNGGAGVLHIAVADIVVYRCRIRNTNAVDGGWALGAYHATLAIIGCYIEATTTASRAFHVASTNMIYGCVIKGGIIGIYADSSSKPQIHNCVFTGQAGDSFWTSITATQYTSIIGCSFYAPLGNGINSTGTLTTGTLCVMNCYFENVNQAAKAAINNTCGSNVNAIRACGNTYYNCTATTGGLGDYPLILDGGILGGPAFTAPANNDFSIRSHAKALGYPGVFENTNIYRSYLDPGAVQRQEPKTYRGRRGN